MKYIIFEDKSVVIFTDNLEFKQMAGPGRYILSAGYCKIGIDKSNDIEVKVFGVSEDLRIWHRPEDADIIKKAITK